MAKLTDYLSEEFLFEKTSPEQKTSLIKDILVDADALVALIKTNDSNHKKALEINDKLQKKGTTYYLSPFTTAEVTTVLSYKVSQQAAKSFLKEIRKLDLPILKLEEKHSSLADKWFLKQNKKGVSYFDCYNMALLERYKAQITAIFSFDAIYKKNGFKLAENL
ncbi:PIN domain-containing protein [Patescibacteria group bacterium]|nr:PIN domain-containing protein [Patescibacteria group bacterium]